MPGPTYFEDLHLGSAVEGSVDVTARRSSGGTPSGAPPVAGLRTVSAVLPNGRVAWLRLNPALASTNEINQFARDVDGARVRHSRAIGTQSDALKRLSRNVAADTKRLSEAQVNGDRKLGRRIVDGDSKIDRRVSKEFGKQKADVKKQLRWERTLVRRSRRRDIWDALVVASSAPLFAAYGQRANPFAPHNLTLALSSLVWLTGDEIMDLLSGPRDGLPSYARDTDLWSYIAPPGNVLTGWWLMRNRQHEQFVTGSVSSFERVASITDPTTARRRDTYIAHVDLSALVASDHVEDFVTFTDVPAVAGTASMTWDGSVLEHQPNMTLSAAVEEGLLTITVVTSAGEGRSESAENGESNALAFSNGETADSAGKLTVEKSKKIPPRMFTELNIVWMVDVLKPKKT